MLPRLATIKAGLERAGAWSLSVAGNLENLFRTDSEFGPNTADAHEAKLTALAGTITRIDPDVLGVPEVGQPEALADLVDRLDGDWHVAMSSFPDTEFSTIAFDWPDRGDAWRLWNTAPLLPEDDPRGTRVYRGRAELIDHILVSHTLTEPIDAVEITADRTLPSVTDDPGARRDAVDSVHAPIVVGLDI